MNKRTIILVSALIGVLTIGFMSAVFVGDDTSISDMFGSRTLLTKESVNDDNDRASKELTLTPRVIASTLPQAKTAVEASVAPNERADEAYFELKSRDDRKAFLKWCAEQKWVRWNSQVLERAMTRDFDYATKVLAYDLAEALCDNEEERLELARAGLNTDSDPLAVHVCDCIRRHPFDQAKQELELTIERSAAVRPAALLALGEFHSPETVTLLESYLNRNSFDEAAKVRALLALGMIASPEALAILRQKMHNESEAIQVTAKRALKLSGQS